MSKKNKLMFAAAVIAVLLLIGSGVARCSLAREDVESTNSAIEPSRRKDHLRPSKAHLQKGARMRRQDWKRSSAPPGRA